jgi:hypothetical protein
MFATSDGKNHFPFSHPMPYTVVIIEGTKSGIPGERENAFKVDRVVPSFDIHAFNQKMCVCVFLSVFVWFYANFNISLDGMCIMKILLNFPKNNF